MRGRSYRVEGKGVGGSYVMGEVNYETGFGSNYASNFSQEKIQNSKFNTGYCIM